MAVKHIGYVRVDCEESGPRTVGTAAIFSTESMMSLVTGGGV